MFIVVDDLGWNDVGFQNNAIPTQRNVMQTPHIDTLATSGVVLDDYTVYKYCSPSRSQMLVKKYIFVCLHSTFNNVSLVLFLLSRLQMLDPV